MDELYSFKVSTYPKHLMEIKCSLLKSVASERKSFILRKSLEQLLSLTASSYEFKNHLRSLQENFLMSSVAVDSFLAAFILQL